MRTPTIDLWAGLAADKAVKYALVEETLSRRLHRSMYHILLFLFSSSFLKHLQRGGYAFTCHGRGACTRGGGQETLLPIFTPEQAVV